MPRAISEPRALARCAAAGKGCCGPAPLRGTPGESDPVCRADKRAFQALLMPRRGGERKIITPAPASSPRGRNSMYSSLIKRRLPRFMAFPRCPQLSGEGDIRAIGVHKCRLRAIGGGRCPRGPKRSTARAQRGGARSPAWGELCRGFAPFASAPSRSSLPSPPPPRSAAIQLEGCSRSPAPSQLPATRVGAAGSRGKAAFSPLGIIRRVRQRCCPGGCQDGHTAGESARCEAAIRPGAALCGLPRSPQRDRGGTKALGTSRQKVTCTLFSLWEALRKQGSPLADGEDNPQLIPEPALLIPVRRQGKEERTEPRSVPPNSAERAQVRSARGSGTPRQLPGRWAARRGERGQQSRKPFALTSSLSPYPGGVLAANVFHKVQSDKKPRNQSQLHSNPLRVPLLLSVRFFFFFLSFREKNRGGAG